ncbi:hypothetical protein M9458_054983 [Cirrhinus mrigala]|uniref:Uncharacterized protein n=1 Tax=Cirrhinus mrigala TaxID=683832 RepID=A0ABD0ML57_CIRMR
MTNHSLAKSDFFPFFAIVSEPSSYSLRTCAGVMTMSARKAEGIVISPAEGGAYPKCSLESLSLEVSCMPNSQTGPQRTDTSPTGKKHCKHCKVRKQINGPHDAPFAQKLDLGWVVVGDVYLGKAHIPSVSTFKTNILENDHTTYLSPCTCYMNLKEEVPYSREPKGVIFGACKNGMHRTSENSLGCDVFQRTENENELALSTEDTTFLRIMDSEVYRDEGNSWVAPLPFRAPRQVLPNNRE